MCLQGELGGTTFDLEGSWRATERLSLIPLLYIEVFLFEWCDTLEPVLARGSNGQSHLQQAATVSECLPRHLSQKWRTCA